MLGCQSVIHRNNSAMRNAGQLSAQNIVRLNAANGEAAAMEVHQGRQWWRLCLQTRGKQFGLHKVAITHGNLQIFDSRHARLRQIQNASRHFVKQTSLLRRQQVHGRAPCALNIAQHQAHGFGQPTVRIVV